MLAFCDRSCLFFLLNSWVLYSILMGRFIAIMRDWSFITSSLSRRGTFFIQCLPPICNGLTMFCLTVCICFLSLFLCLFHTFFKITGRFCKLFFSLHHCILSSRW